MNILHFGGNFLVSALRMQGHHVVSVGLSQHCDIPLRHPLAWARLEAVLSAQGFTPDCALWVDDGNLPAVLGLEALPCPSLFYSIDTFCNPWHIPFAQSFDQVAAAQKGHVEMFPSLADAPVWLPLFAPDDLPVGPADERDIPVAFVGTLRPQNIPKRYPFLEAFRRLHPLFFMQGAYAPIFLRSRIVLNQTAAMEVNFRCFESMACGAALLTESSRQHGLEELFTPGEHMLQPYTPNDAAQAAAIAARWLAEPEALHAVAEAGYARVRERHLASHRAAFIIELLRSLIANCAQTVRLEHLEHRRTLLSTAYAILMSELQSESMKEHQRLYRTLFAELRL